MRDGMLGYCHLGMSAQTCMAAFCGIRTFSWFFCMYVNAVNWL